MDSLLNVPFQVLAYYVHNINPYVIKFSETSDMGIRWYGVAYVLAFILGYWLMGLYHKKGRSPLNDDQLSGLMIWLILGVVVGGRLGYMFLYDWADFSGNPLIFFKIWEGGMASHGGFAGVILAAFLYTRYTSARITFRGLADIICTVVPIGLMLGRIANFINGYLWGKVTDVPWAVIFPNSAPGYPVEFISPRHPSQLYAAGLEGLFLLIYVQIRFWLGKERAEGQLAGEFLMLYGVVRIVDEIFREPDAGLILGLSRGQFYSIFVVVAGAALVVYARRGRRARG